jgi:1-acyl-sn-glycerol-3-phosphate acyltransferase
MNKVEQDDWHFTPIELAVCILIYARCSFLLVFIILFFFPAAFFFPKPVYDEWLRRTSKLFLRFAGVKVISVEGAEHIQQGEPYILAPNHVNFLDPFVYQGYFPYLLRGLEKKENFKIPIWGPWMRAVGQIEVDRENPKKSIESMREVARVLREERTSVMVAPEGTRTPNGKLQPFKRGPFKTSAEAGVSIMPMCSVGLYNINRKGDWRIKSGSVKIVFGKPLGPPAHSIESQKKLSAELRSWMLEQLGEIDFYPETTSQS